MVQRAEASASWEVTFVNFLSDIADFFGILVCKLTKNGVVQVGKLEQQFFNLSVYGGLRHNFWANAFNNLDESWTVCCRLQVSAIGLAHAGDRSYG